ncbi:hypothetical protein HH303_00460 [Rhodospirillaceae bacterium KN72]|uniref:Polysaccharide lyase n=1 Tax=Pacificispira spongiicola TaxID=2729598 RepID=A0A7Y0DWJ7_9PROT|nr:heparin lyase I family protein [Pacificispira spongiicola]NMM42929.1 hypothetical protein [Pacificispira spongiicola]
MYKVTIAVAAMLGLAGCLSGEDTHGWSFTKSLPANFKGYGVQTVAAADGYPVRSGKTSQRFEVRAGDCSYSDDWSDCDNDRERHELKSVTDWLGGERWYHWSIYLPADYPNIYPVKVALGQFHQHRGHVVWMFQNNNGGYWVDNQVPGYTKDFKMILTDADMRGVWNDILVHVNWSDGEDGYFYVYVNGETEPRYAYTGQTKSTGKKVYYKYGLYRSFVSRRGGEEPAQVVYYDDLFAATTCAGLSENLRFDCAKIR